MSRFYYEIHLSSGEVLDGREFVDEDSQYFDTESDAFEAGMEALSAMHLGEELSHMSNPGDYPMADVDDGEVIVVEEY
ncbi:MAG: hypothetical protein IKQ39_08015 [Oscillospiraceae bacterium]|nr:hypothetical protein [Oscillospiraceae bacterium]